MYLLPGSEKVDNLVLDVRKLQKHRFFQTTPPHIEIPEQKTRKFSFVFLGFFILSVGLIISIYSYGVNQKYGDGAHIIGVPDEVTNDWGVEATNPPPPNPDPEVTDNVSPILTTEEVNQEGSSSDTESSPCPECTTTSTPELTTRVLDPIDDNPVSFINRKHQTGAKYSDKPKCNNPEHFRVILKIKRREGSWEGKGTTKQDAKKQAAYRAMQELYPDDLDEVICVPVPCAEMPDSDCIPTNT